MSSSNTYYSTKSSSETRSAYDWEKASRNPYAAYDERTFEKKSYQSRRTNSTSSTSSTSSNKSRSPSRPPTGRVRFSVAS
ncbi:hypothetical protein BP6252_12965 [Coleophoma cylindrospora]|uniref:Uncharacterized protein n=1 Tax=Coleophoma cylindrospora TaxID=1849047 RepID=A0A3D8QE25_9HELO|nr:hypothetical protein BP6252_12965 [Coleophoma cylindrospora]